MKYHQLQLPVVTVVTWIHNIHPDTMSCHNKLKEQIKNMMKSKFDKFQLQASKVNNLQKANIQARAYVVEINRQHAKENLGELFATFHHIAEIMIALT